MSALSERDLKAFRRAMSKIDPEMVANLPPLPSECGHAGEEGRYCSRCGSKVYRIA